MSVTGVIAATAALIVLSAFFVAVEFSLMAVRRHRLEERAASSRSVRAALRSSAELTILLAGAQLGITMCTLGLGAVAKPAVHHAIAPLLDGWGLPPGAASAVAFLLALLVVTFLHLVIGEMAPKSWAIAHPEFAATILALPMRAYMAIFRPLLRALNGAANRIVKAMGVEPVDELSAAVDPRALRALIDHSAAVGALESEYRVSLDQALGLGERTLDEIVSRDPQITAVSTQASVAELQRATLESGHLRVLLRDGEAITGVVHVRETLSVADPRVKAADFARPALVLAPGTPLPEAIRAMRAASTQICVVREGNRDVGVVSLADILPALVPTSTEGA